MDDARGPDVHPLALVDPGARIARDVRVGPWTVIGPDVELGAGTVVGPHVVIQGPCRIGRDNAIFQFASIGADCQDRKYRGEHTRLEIGDGNVIREHVTIHRGTVQDEGVTRIGDRNLLMVGVHVAHDCVLGDDNILANGVGLAGHVRLGDGVVLGGMTGVHQFCRIGSHAMAAGMSLVLKDVAAFTMVAGNPARARGLNVEGMRRRGWDGRRIAAMRRAYRIVFRAGLTLEQALERLREGVGGGTDPDLALFAASLEAARRGITR